MKLFLFGLIVICSIIMQSECLIHHLKIHHDDRNVFKIETFGFIKGGIMNITITDFSISSLQNEKIHSGNISNSNASNPNSYKIGFLMRKANSESAAQEDLEETVERKECIIEHKNSEDVFIDLSNKKAWRKFTFNHEIKNTAEVGLYSLIFSHCLPGEHTVSFTLDAVFYNPGPNFLSAGDTLLPVVYLVFSLIFIGTLILWSWILVRDKGVVHHIHYMMLILLGLKCCTLIFESIRFHYTAIYGVSEMWNVIYYIFAFLNGIRNVIVFTYI